jgi:hypothetical protein
MNDMSNLPWPEQYRLAAEAWVELDKAATMLEETKKLVFAQKVKAQGDMPVNRAENAVLATPEWHHYVTEIVNARTAANHKKVRMEYLRMQFMAWNSENANRRAEMKI